MLRGMDRSREAHPRLVRLRTLSEWLTKRSDPALVVWGAHQAHDVLREAGDALERQWRDLSA